MNVNEYLIINNIIFINKPRLGKKCCSLLVLSYQLKTNSNATNKTMNQFIN